MPKSTRSERGHWRRLESNELYKCEFKFDKYSFKLGTGCTAEASRVSRDLSHFIVSIPVTKTITSCNPIQAGPQNATLYSDANCTSLTGQSSPGSGTGKANAAAVRFYHHPTLGIGILFIMAVFPQVW